MYYSFCADYFSLYKTFCRIVYFERVEGLIWPFSNLFIIILLFKVKSRGLLQKYDEEIEGEQKQSFVLGMKLITLCAFHIVQVLLSSFD